MAGSVMVTNAQSELTFKPFKFDISAGYAIPMGGSGVGVNRGGLFSLEPKYAISDYLTFGLRIEAAVTVKGNLNTDYVKAIASYLATGDYYLNTKTLRPFAGIGLGLFRHASADMATRNEDIQVRSNFGFAPRVGIELAHFRTALEYNFAGKIEGISNNYFGIKIGVLIGGGRIEEYRD